MKDGNGVPTGEVKFTPTDKTYVGEVEPVTVQAKDTNSTVAKTTYTPKFTGVTPKGTPVESTGIQGKTQEGTPTFTPGDDKVPMKIDETQPATFYNPVTKEPITETEIPATKDEKEVGKYTIDPKTGKVTFKPNKDFTGTPDPVTVQAKDANGTPAIATYTPTVTGVTPKGTPAESIGIQGKTQEGTPTFTPGNSEVPITITDEQPAQFVVDGNPVTEKEIPAKDKDGKEVGKYTIDPKSGKVTFKPRKDFVGTPDPATVQAKDANGTPATATYTPTVTPVTPIGEVSETEGARGAVQKSPVVFDTPDQDNTTVNFNKGHEKVALDKSTLTLVDREGKEVKEVKVPGEGTYVLKDGVIEFAPEKDFVGKASGVTVQVKDENGKAVSKTYTPTVRPDTKFVVVGKDGKETELIPSKDGEKPSESIPGYKVVKTEKDEKGNTKHIYEKVTTSFKDKEGKEIPNYPTEEGTTPKKDNIPGYRFVETKKLPNGDTEHVYEKVKTSFKGKDGNEIPNYPTEEGDQPKKDIPGYRFVETKKLPNGDVEHVYEKVTTPAPTPAQTVEKTTSWVDEDGNPIKSSENGTREHGVIPGFEFVRTVVDKDGNVRHIFRKVTVEKVKQLPNTGATETNTGLAGLGLGILGGLLAAVRRRKEK